MLKFMLLENITLMYIRIVIIRNKAVYLVCIYEVTIYYNYGLIRLYILKASE